MTYWPSEQTVITHLRVRGSELDPLRTQLRTANVLNTLSLHPAGLSPTAILCIRSLRDPKPGTLRLQRNEARPPPEWERAIAASIDQFARQAARPIRSAVPANAEAVLFADRAELLACLASDWIAGELIARWWWRSLFRNVDIARAVLTAWLDSIAYVPAALHDLAVRRQAVAFVGRLNDDMAYPLRQATVRAFGLSELHSALSESRHADTPRSGESTTRLGPTQPRPKMPSPAPWQRWVPEADQGELRVEQQCLLGIGLMLQRAPSVARTSSFARAMAEWYRAAMAASTVPSEDVATPEIQRPAMAARSLVPSTPDRVQDEAISVAQTSAPSAETSENDRSRQHVKSNEAPQHKPDEHASTERTQAQAHSDPSWIDTSATTIQAAHAAPNTALISHEPEGEQHAIAFASESQPEVTTEISAAAFDFDYEVDAAAATVDDDIDTDFGGIFYLINMGLFLGLYGDFTTPLTPGIALPIWDFVALMGQALVGERLRADPAWELLARLAGRHQDEPPGKGFEPPDEWRVPTDWLASFPERAVWQWSFDGERLRVQHQAGFCLIDIPVEVGDHIEQLRQALRTYTGSVEFELEQTSEVFADFRSPTGLERWLRWLAPYIHTRLQRALGVADAEVPRVVCEQRAHITVTATNFDVYLELAELPIEVRLAGLDRDPGWVPAAGKFVLFHFEG